MAIALILDILFFCLYGGSSIGFFQIDQKPLVERSFPKSSPSDLLYRVVDDLVPVTAGPDQGSERIGTLHQGDVS